MNKLIFLVIGLYVIFVFVSTFHCYLLNRNQKRKFTLYIPFVAPGVSLLLVYGYSILIPIAGYGSAGGLAVLAHYLFLGLFINLFVVYLLFKLFTNQIKGAFCPKCYRSVAWGELKCLQCNHPFSKEDISRCKQSMK